MKGDPALQLAGRRALVTGASRGIGRAIAIELARQGASVVATSRGIDAASDLATEIRRLGVSYESVIADLLVPSDVDGIVDDCRSAGGVDILICNAGIAERAPAEDHDDGQWQRTFEVNLNSQFRLARALGSDMLARGEGKIVFIASMMSFQGGRDVISYTASKSAVIGVVRGLANEWAERGINVNAIAPGYVSTDLTSMTHSDPNRYEAFRARIPAGRWAQPEDIAGPAVFLASPAADYIHGVVLPVDGGWLVR